MRHPRLYRSGKDWRRIAQRTLRRCEPVAYRILTREFDGPRLILSVAQDGMEEPDCDCVLLFAIRNGPIPYDTVAVVYDLWWHVDGESNDLRSHVITLSKYRTKVAKFIAGLEPSDEQPTNLGAFR